MAQYTMESPFMLQNLPGFPYISYTNQQDTYTILENWYQGTYLNEYTIDKQSGKRIEKYPIKINPIRGTCEKHASALFGQMLDSLHCGAIPVRILADTSDVKDIEINKTATEIVEKAIKEVFADNGAGSMFLSNGVLSQYLRGCVFAASWLPKDKRILITNPSPREFFGIPKGADYWNLSKAWIIREIDKEVAETYDVVINQADTVFYYIEYWDEKNYEVTINGKVIKDDDGNPMKGENPWGKVPVTYIPHIRTNAFLGTSMITEMIKGLVRELNLRWADAGDAVNDDSHQPVAMRNVRGKIDIKHIEGRPIIDLGAASGLAAGEQQPDLFSVSLKSASEVMLNLGKDLYEMYRREADHPAVADGEDSGSQRSSLTLGVKMWPMVAHVEMERMNWTVGLGNFCSILLNMMMVKGLYGITEEHVKTKLKIAWAPMLPQDRKTLVDEVAIRSSSKLGSQEHLMTLLGDIPNVEEEKSKILAEKEEAIELAQKAAPPVVGADGKTVPPKKNKDAPDTPPKKESKPK